MLGPKRESTGELPSVDESVLVKIIVHPDR